MSDDCASGFSEQLEELQLSIDELSRTFNEFKKRVNSYTNNPNENEWTILKKESLSERTMVSNALNSYGYFPNEEEYNKFRDEWDEAIALFRRNDSLGYEAPSHMQVKLDRHQKQNNFYGLSDIIVSLAYMGTTVNCDGIYKCYLSNKKIDSILGNKKDSERLISREQLVVLVEIIVEIKEGLKEFYYSKNNFFKVYSDMDELTSMLEIIIGYNQYAGKFRITEFSEIILQEIGDVSRYSSKSVVNKILKDINHLLFRLCSFTGYVYEEMINYLVSAD